MKFSKYRIDSHIFMLNILKFSLVAQILFYYSVGGAVSWWPYIQLEQILVEPSKVKGGSISLSGCLQLLGFYTFNLSTSLFYGFVALMIIGAIFILSLQRQKTGHQ